MLNQVVEIRHAELFNDFVKWLDRCEKTTSTYIKNLRQFAAYLRYMGITDVTRQDLINYRDWLMSEHDAIRLDNNSPAGWTYRTDRNGNKITITCSPNTVRQYLRVVCQLFKWRAAAGGYPDISANIHTPKIKSNESHRKEALNPSDVLKIEKSILQQAAIKENMAAGATKDRSRKIERSGEQGKRIYAMYLLAVNVGLRTIEISRANIKDLEIKNGAAWLYIWGKGHADADTKKPLAPEVAAALTDYINSRSDKPTSSSPLFVATGNRSGGKRLAATTISTMLKKSMQEAGYNSDKITAHSLRHTAGTQVMELTGNNIYTTQQYMRHTSPKTTEIYLHNDTTKQELGIAQQLFNSYHGIKTDEKDRLNNLINRLTPGQLEKLAEIAEVMAS